MKKAFIILFTLSVIANIAMLGYIGFTYYKDRTNRDIFRLNRYAYSNSRLEAPTFDENRIVFIGNSITENWIHLRYRYFIDNNYVCRGVGGQTSPLFLLRFRSDVIDLKPKAVVINAGINDIGEKTGVFDAKFTMDNIKSMAQLAEINGIKVILTSLLPCEGAGWKKDTKTVSEKVRDLNIEIEAYAKEKNYAYANYYAPMVNDREGLKNEYTFDGLHPNEEGYKIMESVLDPIIIKKIK